MFNVEVEPLALNIEWTKLLVKEQLQLTNPFVFRSLLNVAIFDGELKLQKPFLWDRKVTFPLFPWIHIEGNRLLKSLAEDTLKTALAIDTVLGVV